MGNVIQSGIPYSILTAAMLIGLAATVMHDPYISRGHRRVMLVIILMCACLIVQNYADSVLGYSAAGSALIRLRTLVSVIGYSLRPVVIILFFYVIDPGRRYTWAWVVAAVNAVIYSTSFFCEICFYITSDNIWQSGPLGKCCHVLSLILLLYFLYLTFDTFMNAGKTEMLMPVFNVLLIIAGTYLDYRDKMDRPITFLTIAIVISSIFSYIWLHLQFARAHEEDMKAQQRLQIMMSQMRPHFLFNTLATVQALCSTDPEKAAKITGKFGKYLRQNIESLEQNIRIPFDKEMEHTLNYADIEMVRFPNIRVETDLQDQDFTIPALTVQPIVENAIRHGVRICEEGVVRISSRKDGLVHEIVIEDNGKGFDRDEVSNMNGLHLGIRNVTERIVKICSGSVDVQTEPGNGTRVVIRIPEEVKV